MVSKINSLITLNFSQYLHIKSLMIIGFAGKSRSLTWWLLEAVKGRERRTTPRRSPSRHQVLQERWCGLHFKGLQCPRQHILGPPSPNRYSIDSIYFSIFFSRCYYIVGWISNKRQSPMLSQSSILHILELKLKRLNINTTRLHMFQL